MDVSLFAFSLMFLSLLKSGEAYYYYSNYSVYSQWWFWLIVVVVFLLKLSCLCCYIKSRRERQATFYAQTVPNGTNIQQQAGFPGQPGFAHGVYTPVSNGTNMQQQAGFPGHPAFATGVYTQAGIAQQPVFVAMPQAPPPYTTGPQAQWNSKSDQALLVPVDHQSTPNANKPVV